MKQKLLTLMMSVMCILGMSAQEEIVWEDPIGQYQTETVVYAAVVVNNMPSLPMFTLGSQWRNFSIGAFVNGELRDVVDAQEYTSTVNTSSQMSVKVEGLEPSETGQTYQMPVYAFRVVGDEANDAGAQIEFRVLVDQGIVYKARAYTIQNFLRYSPSLINNKEYAYQDEAWADESTINWGGDITVNEPTQYYILNFAPVMQVESTPETVSFDLRIGDPAVNLREQFESFRYLSEDGVEVAAPIEGGYWQAQGDGYLEIEGDNVTAIAVPESGGPVQVMYNYMGDVGSSVVAYINVLEPWVHVEDIMVNDVTLYKGQSTVPEVIFNNGESTPTETGYTMVANNTEVVEVLNGKGLNALEIGETTVKVTSVGTNSDGNTVSYDFAVNVLSAMADYGFQREDATVEHEKALTVWITEGEMNLSNFLVAPTPIPVEGFEGDLPWDFWNFTMTSNNPDVVAITEDSGAIAKQKGVATVTCTSVYDPSFSATYVVTVKQAPRSIEFYSYTIAGGEEQLFSELTAGIISLNVGQTVTVKAKVSPENADYDEGSFILDLNEAEYGQYVELITASKAEGNECTITFKALAQGRGPINAQLTYTQDGDPITIENSIYYNIKESVTSIEAADETTIWFNNAGEMFEFPITVLPETASNKYLNFTYESLDEGVSFLTSPISLDLTDTGYMLTVNSKGNVKVTATSVDNPSVSKTFKIYLKRRVEGIVFETDGNATSINMYNDGQEYNVYARISPADADFIEDEFSLVAEYSNDNFGGESGWDAFSSYILEIVQNPETANAGGEYYYNYRITGKALCPDGFNLTARYSGVSQDMPVEKIAGIDVTVKEKIEIPTGWSWISLTSGTHTTNINGLVEARSQTQLVYNDPSYGYFGDFEMMNPNAEAYKLNMEETYNMFPIYSANNSAFISGTAPSMTLRKGWNWVGYPYEYSYMASEVFDASQFAEGDLILSKDSGLAALKNGVWENDFELTPNTGYMVYHNGEEISVECPGRFDMDQGSFAIAQSLNDDLNTLSALSLAKRNESVWNYDGSRFANTMAIIGDIQMNDDASCYSIGAFVGDECRGEGKVVNGTAYITVAGEAGETVSFRLYNKWSGNYSNVDTQLDFTDLAGSVKAPVKLFAPVLTGIDETTIGSQGIYFNGNTLNLGEYDGTATIMTADGKVAATTTEASISVDELPAGVYVVIINSENGRIVKKIAKN